MSNNINRMGRPPKEPATLMGARLQALRMEKGWSQERLAKKSGVSVSTIKNIEHGVRDPSLFSAICLADALGVTLDFLVLGRGTYTTS